jgi:imidazoleglycerol phosphate dehydratase HisB
VSLRTYLPTLRFLARALCSYADRNSVRIKSHLGTDAHRTAFDVAIAACKALDVILDEIIGTPT